MAAPSLLAPTGAPLPPESAPSTSLASKFWELEPSDKRGVFNFVGYQKNYVLPIHVTSRINRFLDPGAGDSYQIDRSIELEQRDQQK